MSDDGLRIADETPKALLVIKSDDGRTLLEIHPDGSVQGEIEDANEAARVFVNAVRQMFGSPVVSTGPASDSPGSAS